VLDDSMSSFMADLSLVPYDKAVKKDTRSHAGEIVNQNLDQARIMARLPHKATWIEWNQRVRIRRSMERMRELGMLPKQYDDDAVFEPFADYRAETSPRRSGWLCLQHPQIETAFMAIMVISDVVGPDEQLMPRCEPSSKALGWTVDDNPLPWQEIGANSAAILTGHDDYRSGSVGTIWSPFTTKAMRHAVETQYRNADDVADFKGDLRYLWTFLATLNDVPVTITDVRASKGFVGRGQYRRYLDHSVVRLNVPQRLAKRVAAKAIALLRKRAHQVRGHWRTMTRGDNPCDTHTWFGRDEAGRVPCLHCQSYKTWIHEHQRGDASLGFVVHDFSLHHPKEH
jgi:hypothetical protein